MTEINLHLGCGPVYLNGWINIDAYNKDYAYLSTERQDLLEYNKTDLNNYYKYTRGTRKGDFVVVDRYMDLLEIPYPFENESVDKILIVNTFEHFSQADATKLLKEWFRVLKSGGELIIDVPDLIETLKILENEKDVDEMNWGIRLVYGSQKNDFSFHKWGYTLETISDLSKKIGFKKVEKINLIKHDYPMIMVKIIK
jgi:predicted SAM-dependent methyltransferase